MSPPVLDPAFRLYVEVDPPLGLGETEAGSRRVVPITGGALAPATGCPLPAGRVLPGGSDTQLVRPSGDVVLDARYLIRLDDGSLVHVRNRGLRCGPAELMHRLNRGEEVDAAAIYFRTAPVFETGAPAHRWLERRIFVATAIRRPARVELEVFVLG